MYRRVVPSLLAGFLCLLPVAVPAQEATEPPPAEEEGLADDMVQRKQEEVKTWPQKLDALAADIEALKPEVANARAAASAEKEAVARMERRAARLAMMALLASSLKGKGTWLILPTLLVLALMLVFRPGTLTRFFRRETVAEAYRVRRWMVPDGTPVLRYVLLGIIVLLMLGFSLAAFAQQAPAARAQPLPSGIQKNLDIVKRYLAAEGRDRLITRLELLRGMDKAVAEVWRPDGFPATFPEMDKVRSGSLEHIAMLTILYLQANRGPEATAMDAALAEACPRALRGDGQAVMTTLGAVLAEKRLLPSMPQTYAKYRDLVTNVFAMVDLAQRLEAENAAWAEELVTKAEGMAWAPEEMLMVLGYRRTKGETTELQEKIAALQKRLKAVGNPRSQADIFAAATRYKFPEIADMVFQKLEAANLTVPDALYVLERADDVGALDRAAPLVVNAVGNERSVERLLNAYDQGKRRNAAAIAGAALDRLLSVGQDDFRVTHEAMQGLQQRGLKAEVERLFGRALGLARNRRDAESLVEFARQHLSGAHVDDALVRYAGFLSYKKDLRKLLAIALDEKRLPLAAGVAARLGDLDPWETWTPPEFLSLADSRAFYDEPVRVGTLANYLLQATGRDGYLERQWDLALPVIGWLVFSDSGSMKDSMAKLLANELTSFGVLLEAAGHGALGGFVRGPLADVLMKRLGVTPPIPKALKPRWDELSAQKAELAKALEEAEASLAASAERMTQLRAQMAKSRTMVAKGAIVVVVTFLLVLLALWVAFLRAALAARKTETYRCAAFLLTFLETIGWEMAVTVVMLPMGLLLVGGSQCGLVLFTIHRDVQEIKEEAGEE